MGKDSKAKTVPSNLSCAMNQVSSEIALKYHFLASSREHLNSLTLLFSSTACLMDREEAKKFRSAIEAANEVIAPHNQKLWK